MVWVEWCLWCVCVCVCVWRDRFVGRYSRVARVLVVMIVIMISDKSGRGCATSTDKTLRQQLQVGVLNIPLTYFNFGISHRHI